MKNPQPKLIMQSSKGRKDKKIYILKIYPCVLAQHKPQTQVSFAAQVEALKTVKAFLSRFRKKNLKFHTMLLPFELTQNIEILEIDLRVPPMKFQKHFVF